VLMVIMSLSSSASVPSFRLKGATDSSIMKSTKQMVTRMERLGL
jgi:hypothetical protein